MGGEGSREGGKLSRMHKERDGEDGRMDGRKEWPDLALQINAFWHKDNFELIILKNSRHRRSSENRVDVTLF